MNRLRRCAHAALLVALAILALPSAAPASPMTPYDKQAFLDAQNAGKPIVVFVHAWWCVTCRKQQPIVERLTKDQHFGDVVVFVVNYDKDKDTLRELNVADRSTLVAFRGKAERKRASFVTAPAEIEALFQSTL
jgi:thiol-disulfide isomerase/thioredoxin